MSSNQLIMNSFLAPEEKFFEDIREDLLSVIEQYHFPEDFLSFDEKKAYFTIAYQSSVVARFKFVRKRASAYIEIPGDVALEMDQDMKCKKTKDGMLRVEVRDVKTAARDVGGMVCKALDFVINQCPKSFDCCSRYEQCSDAKMCVHPDGRFAMGCGYRKILSSGKVFYGKNRNV